jgi:hypothetical protein
MPLVHASSEPASFAATIGEKFQQITDLTGACCDPATGICIDDVLQADCQDPLQWNEGVPCDQVECEPKTTTTGVPTMSQWGMIAMGILLAALLIWSVRRRWAVRAGNN